MKNHFQKRNTIAFVFISLIFCFFTTSISLAKKITFGSVITIEAEDVSTTNVFTSKPKVSAVYVDPIKLKEKTTKLKVINKINKKIHPSSVDVEWKKKIKLCNSKKFSNTETVFQNLENNPNKIVNCQMNFNGLSNQTLYILPPEISGIYNTAGNTIISAAKAGNAIVIKGKYFGTKIPAVYLEYVNSNGKVKTIKCKVDKKALIYNNAKGKPHSSAMSIYDGTSQITVEIPKNLPWNDNVTKNHNIVLKNKLGVATVFFNTGDEKTELKEISVPDGFNYVMTKEIGGTAPVENYNSYVEMNDISDSPIQLYLKTQNGVAIPNARVRIYTGTNYITTATTDDKGMYEIDVNIADAVNELQINYNYVGAINGITLDLQTGGITPTEAPMPPEDALNIRQENLIPSSNLYFMGSYNNYGVPDYLIEPDILDAHWLSVINYALPERRAVPTYHPEYLVPGLDMNTILVSNADVWVTFVHEGAGYKNVLGYFTYDVGTPPLTADAIVSNVVVFPNLSYPHLKSGDKVFLGTFPANTGIGYFLIANGWNGSSVGNGYNDFYSITDLNPEIATNNKQHSVLLWSEKKKLQILGFEDLNREEHCDNDFNDAVFYITVTPNSAVSTNTLPPINDDPVDTDGDGVFDDFDDYPEDPARAFDNYYPSKTRFGTLAFEDNWPKKADYDMNDLVLQYNFKYVTDSNNFVKDIFPHFKIMAVGASYHNGFGFELGTESFNVISNIQNLSISNNSYVLLNDNNTEADQVNATVIVFDDVFNLISPPPGYDYVNTDTNEPYVEPVHIEFAIYLGEPVSKNSLGSPPYNPFMIANIQKKARTNEIHLPGFPPTSLAVNIGTTNLFGTQDDDSYETLYGNKYYLTEDNLPWGLNIPRPWDYCIEKAQILRSYSRFGTWAQSKGTLYKDWYKDLEGYRNEALIYKQPN